ncbi:MAG: dienelactone hydrolase family protein [Chitinivibrionales bacterium]|nr:dienelactone hydrolase family protein [Chitinivibrionales bacterium]
MVKSSKILMVGLVTLCFSVSWAAEKYNNQLDKRSFVAAYQNAYSFEWLKYLMYVPKDYAQSKKSYPLILFFHGAGQKGEDAALLRACSLPKQLEENKKESFPFIVVAPQLTGKVGFEMPYSLDRGTWYPTKFLKEVNDLLDHLIERYAIDTARIYCVGASMGAGAVWKMAALYPTRFAAIAPLCGEGNQEDACKVKNIPIYVYHCQKDEIMPVAGSDAMVAAVKKCGGRVEFVRPEGGNHEQCWSNQFDDLYKWLLKYHK